MKNRKFQIFIEHKTKTQTQIIHMNQKLFNYIQRNFSWHYIWAQNGHQKPFSVGDAN